jgi:transglutaminase-like putative cysteine protease
MSAAEVAALAARITAGTATPAERAAYGREIAAQAGIDAYSLATLRTTEAAR